MDCGAGRSGSPAPKTPEKPPDGPWQALGRRDRNPHDAVTRRMRLLGRQSWLLAGHHGHRVAPGGERAGDPPGPRVERAARRQDECAPLRDERGRGRLETHPLVSNRR